MSRQQRPTLTRPSLPGTTQAPIQGHPLVPTTTLPIVGRRVTLRELRERERRRRIAAAPVPAELRSPMLPTAPGQRPPGFRELVQAATPSTIQGGLSAFAERVANVLGLREELGRTLPERSLFGGPVVTPPTTPPSERRTRAVPAQRAVPVHREPIRPQIVERTVPERRLIAAPPAQPAVIERAPNGQAIWRVRGQAEPVDFQRVIGDHNGMRFIYHVANIDDYDPTDTFEPTDPENAWYGVTTMDRGLVSTIRVRGVSSIAIVKNMYKAFKALSHGYTRWIGYVQIYSSKASPANFELFHGNLNCVLAAIARQTTAAKAAQVVKYATANGWYDPDHSRGATKKDIDAFAKALRVGIRVYCQYGDEGALWYESGCGRKNKIVEVFASADHASDYSPITYVREQVICREQRAIGPYKSEAKRPVISAHTELMKHYDAIHGIKRISASVVDVLDPVGLLINSFRHEDRIYKTWQPPEPDHENPAYFSCTSELSYVVTKWKLQNRIRPLQEPYFSIFRAADHHLTTQQFQPYYLQAETQAPPTLHKGDGMCTLCREFHDLDALLGVVSTCPGAPVVETPAPASPQFMYHSYDMNKAFPSFKTSPLYAKYKIFYGFVNLYTNTDLAYIQRPGASLVTAVTYHNPVLEATRWIQPGCWYTHIRLGFALMERLVDIEISHTVVAASEDMEYPFGDVSTWGDRKKLNNAFIGNLIMGGMNGVTKDVYAVSRPDEAQQIMYELGKCEDTIDVIPMPGFIIHLHRARPTQLYHIHAQILDYQQTTFMANICRIPLSNLVAFFTDGFYTREPIPLESADDPGRFKYKGLEMIKGSSTFAAPVHHTYEPPENTPPLSAHVNRLVGFKATTGPAGCGKTYISFEKHPRLAKVSLAPTHKKKADLLRYPALTVDTYHKFFKIGTSAHDTKQQIAEQVDIDEITMCTDEHMQQIIKTCMRHRMNLSIYGDFAMTDTGDIRIFQRPPANGKPISSALMRAFKITEEISDHRRQDPASAAWLDGLRTLRFPDVLAKCRAQFPVVKDEQVPIADNSVFGISARHDRCTQFNHAFAAAAKLVNDEPCDHDPADPEVPLYTEDQQRRRRIRVRRVARSCKDEYKGAVSYMPPGDFRVWLDRSRAVEKPPKGTIYEAAQFVTADYIQGDTIEGPMYIDLTHCDAENFLYVALTRCRSLDQIRLIEDPATAVKQDVAEYAAAYKKYASWISIPRDGEDMPYADNTIETDMRMELGAIRLPGYNRYANYPFMAEPDDATTDVSPRVYARINEIPAGTFVVREELGEHNRFLSFKNAGEYFLYRNGRKQEFRTHHEVMRKKLRPVYVDIDEEIPLDDTRLAGTTPERYALRRQADAMEKFLAHLQRHVNHGLMAPFPLTYMDLVVLEACGHVQKEGKSPAYKLSFHIICPFIHMDITRMAAFASTLERELRVDLSVYTPNRCMRMEGCVKPGSARVLRRSRLLPHLKALTPWQLFSICLLSYSGWSHDRHGAPSHVHILHAADHHYTSAGSVMPGKHMEALVSPYEIYLSQSYVDEAVTGKPAPKAARADLTDARVKAILEHPAVAPKVAGLRCTGVKKGRLIQLIGSREAHVCGVCERDHTGYNSYYLLQRDDGSVAFGCCYDASTRKAAGQKARHVELIVPVALEKPLDIEPAAMRTVQPAEEPPFDADIMAALAEMPDPVVALEQPTATPAPERADNVAAAPSADQQANVEAQEAEGYIESGVIAAHQPLPEGVVFGLGVESKSFGNDMW